MLNALPKPGGYALGALAGEAAIRQVTADAGFTRCVVVPGGNSVLKSALPREHDRAWDPGGIWGGAVDDRAGSAR